MRACAAPSPSRRTICRETGAGREAVKFIVVVIGFGEPVLIPHGIGDHAIKGTEFTAVFGTEFWVIEGVPNLNLTFHVVDDHIHVCHCPGLGDVFLTVEFDRSMLFVLGALFHRYLAFHEKTARTAARVVDGHARLWLEDARHDSADFGRGVELSSTLAATLSKFADEVFVTLADDVGFNIIKPKALGADCFNEIGEAVVINVALAVGSSVEINAVNNAFQ